MTLGELFKRRWRRLMLPVLLAVGAIVIALPQAASAASPYTISGTVTNDSTSAAIGGAKVTVSDEYNSDGVATTTTNASGQYSITVQNDDDYTVSVVAPGYATQTTTAFFDNSATTTTADAELDPASFSGTVTDAPSGNAASGVEVELFDATGSYEADETVSNADGYYAFPDGDFNSGDTYEIAFAPYGNYATSWYVSGVPAGSSTEAGGTALTAEQQGLNGALTPTTGEITGTISDAAGTVSGASVQVLDVNDNDEATGAAVTTSSTGTYVVSGLASGSYVVEAIPPMGSPDIATYSGNAGDPYSAATITVTSPSAATGNNITLTTGSSVSGTITNSAGTGLADVTVDVRDASGDTIGSAITAADGTYSVDGLAPGTYYVYVDASEDDSDNGTDYASQWYGATGGSSASLDESSASAVTVASGANSVVNQALVLGGEISGTVNDAATGQGLSGYADAYDAAGDPIGYGYYESGSSTAGAYTISGLPAGNYYVQFTPASYTSTSGKTVQDATAFWGGSGALAVSLQTASPVAVSLGATPATANAALPVGANIQGTVTSGGQPLSGAFVQIYDTNGNALIGSTGSATSAADGVYKVTGLLPGSYKVGFSTDANLGFQYYNGVSSLSAANAVGLSAGQTATGINANLSAGGSVTGTVTDASSKADLPGIEVYLEDAQGHVLDSAVTRIDGSYTLAGVPAGTYYVEFDPSGAYATQYQVQYLGGSQVLAGSSTVSVANGAATSNINAALVSDTTAAKTVSTQVTVATPVPSVTGATPTIAGTVKVGDKLTAKLVGWTSGATDTYQWFAGAIAIKGATGASLTLGVGQYKKAISVEVTGAKSGYNWLTAKSKATKAVAAGTLKRGTPTISGTAKAGKTLAAKTGTWTKGAKLSYQWYASGKAIKGATKSKLKLAKAQSGKKITVKVTGKLTGYATASRVSKATKKVVK